MSQPEQQHRILREVLRHYHEFEAYCSQYGIFYIEHKGITLSFPDLQGALASLSPRKKEAVTLNVIYDMKQKDVAERMGITTVSVGQYVEQACLQLAKRYFADDPTYCPSPVHKKAGGLDATQRSRGEESLHEGTVPAEVGGDQSLPEAVPNSEQGNDL